METASASSMAGAGGAPHRRHVRGECVRVAPARHSTHASETPACAVQVREQSLSTQQRAALTVSPRSFFLAIINIARCAQELFLSLLRLRMRAASGEPPTAEACTLADTALRKLKRALKGSVRAGFNRPWILLAPCRFSPRNPIVCFLFVLRFLLFFSALDVLARHHLSQTPHRSTQVVTPGDDAYTQRRRVWNADIDRKPALIVRCMVRTSSSP